MKMACGSLGSKIRIGMWLHSGGKSLAPCKQRTAAAEAGVVLQDLRHA